MPIPFCVCQICSEARRVGGKNLRRRSSLMINDDLLVDIGPDIATASFEYGLSLAGISVCLQTHPHDVIWISGLSSRDMRNTEQWYHEACSLSAPAKR